MKNTALRVFPAAAVLLVLVLFPACSGDVDTDYGIQPLEPEGFRADQLPIPPPPQETNIRLMVHGDTQAGHVTPPVLPPTPVAAIHAAMIQRFISRHASHIFHTGDLVETGGSTAHWNEWQSITSPLDRYPGMKYYPTIGNHEKILDPDYSNYFAYTGPLPQNGSAGHLGEWYYVVHEKALFVVLRIDTATRPGDFETQKSWLGGVLSNPAYNDRFKFVFFHIPAHSSGIRTDAGYAAELDSIFQANGVDAVFNGHTHAYERLEVGGIPYFVTGGAGATLQDWGQPDGYSVYKERCHNYVEVLILDEGDEAQVTAWKLNVNGMTVGGFEVLETLTLTP